MKILSIPTLAATTAALCLVACQTQTRRSFSAEEKTTPEVTEVKAKPAAAPRTTSRKPAGASMLRSTLAYPTGDPATSALLVDWTAPLEVIAGQTFEYEINVTNLTSMRLENVVVTESLPDEMTVSSTTPKMIGGEPGVGRWDLGSLEPHEARDIRIMARAKEAGSINTCSTVSYNTQLCMSIPVVQPALALAVRGPEEILLCEDLEYVYTVTNTGSGAARNVLVKSQLPMGLETKDGKNAFSSKLDALGAGESKELKILVRATQRGVYDHTASASAMGDLSAKAGVVKTTVREPVLELTQTGSKKEYLGRDLTFEIQIKNVGDGIARDTWIEEVVPSGTSFKSATAGGLLSKGHITWKLGVLKPGDVRKVQYVLGPTRPGTFNAHAVAKADCADGVKAVAATEVAGIPAIMLEVVDLEDPIRVGDTETYVISVTNQGTAAATNVRIVCNLPKNVEYVSTTGTTAASAGVLASGRLELAALPSLAPKAKASWKVVVRGMQAEDTRFHVVLTSDQLTRPVEETEATYFYE